MKVPDKPNMVTKMRLGLTPHAPIDMSLTPSKAHGKSQDVVVCVSLWSQFFDRIEATDRGAFHTELW